MTSFDVRKAFLNRNFFRFTGPPENWLTAIKFMTWGLEEKYLNRWKEIQPGDVFIMHSTAKSEFIRNPKSKIVGLGVVGGRFVKKNEPLWIQEINTNKSIWPLRVPFSEIYLFSDLPAAGNWEAPGFTSAQNVENLIQLLLARAVPTSDLDTGGVRFPVMGSISSIRSEMAGDLLSKGELTLHTEFYDYSEPEVKAEALEKISSVEASIRHTPTLKFLSGSGVKVREISRSTSFYERDNSLLERAEESHANILKQAIAFFQAHGFDTWSNNHVDLLAESGPSGAAYLIEVKSTLNHNFRTQARRAIGQLFEYEYFDVRKHYEKKSSFPRIHKSLMVSDNPVDPEYSGLLSNLNVSIWWPSELKIQLFKN